MAAAAIDAKLTKLQNIKVSDRQTTIEYVNRLDNLVNELHDAGHILSDLEKRHTPLCGLHEDFSVIGKVIKMSDRSPTDAASQ